MNELNVELDGNGLKIGIVAARFNQIIVEQLLAGAHARLLSLGVSEENVTLGWVAGAFEIPLAAKQMSRKLSVDAVICLGCVICVPSPFFPLLFPISYFLHSRVAIPHPAPVKKAPGMGGGRRGRGWG